MRKVILRRKKGEVFYTSEKILFNKELIQWLLDEKYLEYVVVDSCPEQCEIQIVINIEACEPGMGYYELEFRTEHVVNLNELNPNLLRLNRDLELSEDTNKINFSIVMETKHMYLYYNEEADTIDLLLPGVVKIPQSEPKQVYVS